MSGRLGQFEDFAFDYEPPSFEFELPEIDYSLPEFEVPSYDPGIYDPGYSFEEPTFVGPTFEEPTVMGETFFDEAGNQYSFDETGALVAATDPAGNTTFYGADGNPTEQVSIDGSQTTSPLPPMPSVNQLLSWGQQAANIYRQFTSPTGTTAVQPRPGSTRMNPATGAREYYNPQTRAWQPTPPTAAAGAQLIPGVSNTMLVVGLGVVGLAFVLARR